MKTRLEPNTKGENDYYIILDLQSSYTRTLQEQCWLLAHSYIYAPAPTTTTTTGNNFQVYSPSLLKSTSSDCNHGFGRSPSASLFAAYCLALSWLLLPHQLHPWRKALHSPFQQRPTAAETDADLLLRTFWWSITIMFPVNCCVMVHIYVPVVCKDVSC
jgi:hypothetical protein